MKPFVHLHVHTEYSLLDGAVRIDDVFRRCEELNMPAVAMTDHGNMYGAIEFIKAAAKYTDPSIDYLQFIKERRAFKVKPIIGCEVYMTDDMHSRQKGTDGAPPKLNHFILLAKNELGYHNLIKIVSKGFTDGMYYKPRVDYECLKRHSEGIIALSACLAGVIPQAILRRDYNAADEWIKKFKALYGDDFYIEIQDHGIAEQKRIIPHLLELAKSNDVKVVATNDAHYLTKDDASMQKVLMAIAFHSTLDSIDGDGDSDSATYTDDSMAEGKYFPTREFYLKSYDEMLKVFPELPEALNRTLEIADKIDPYVISKQQLLPSYTPPDGLSSRDYLRKLTFEGLERRYGNVTNEIRERAEYELSIVERLNFVDYFLIVWDFIHYAESVGIPVGPGRGSGAGSIIAYAIGITKINPLKYQLFFERFLNPERVTNPDFDVDFCVDRRGEVIDYVVKKYGAPNVSQIATFGTMATKAAIKDVGRVFKLEFAEVNKITKMIPRGSEKLHINQLLGKDPNVPGVPDLIALYNSDPVAKRVLDMALKIEGMPRQIGMHAAGVIICRDPIADHVPLARTKEDIIVTQYDMTVNEALGLLKMDFLGLTTLTDIKKAQDNVKKVHGIDVDFDKIGYDDPKVYELIGSGNTEAVFQLESGGMKNFMRELKPDSLEDIIAGISLYRPGPMDSIPTYIKNKKNPASVAYDHKLLKPILEVTYGVIVYQEQVMQIVRALGGYSMGRSDNVRRMMSKKKEADMEKEREIFINGGVENGKEIPGAIKMGVDKATANKVYDNLIKFASYGFNKSHAAAYAYLAYQTAYLKCYYPVEYFTAVLNNRITKIDELSHYLTYLKEAKIPVLSPSINKSGAEYTVDNNSVRIGLGSIKGVGLPIINRIIEEREKNGEYKDFIEFITRMEDLQSGKSLINRRMVEQLIFAGAFDCFNKKRSVLIACYGDIMDRVASNREAKMRGQISFFDAMPQMQIDFKYPEMDEYKPNYKYLKEKEVAGVYLSGHPLAAYVDKMKTYRYNTAMLNNDNSDQAPPLDTKLTIAGMLTSTVNKMTKKGKPMGTAVLEDLYGSIELVAFGNSYEAARPVWINDTVVAVTGTLKQNDNGVSFWVDSITPFTDADANNQKVCCYLSLDDKAKTADLREIVKAYPGSGYLYVKNTADDKLYRLSDKFSVEPLSLGELCAVLGEDNVKLN